MATTTLRSSRWLSLLGAVLAGVSCSTITAPWAHIPRQARPFYYYQGQPIYLDVDSTRISFITTLPLPESVYTPLEIAAYYEQQPIVECASPDFFSNYQPGSIHPAER